MFITRILPALRASCQNASGSDYSGVAAGVCVSLNGATFNRFVHKPLPFCCPHAMSDLSLRLTVKSRQHAREASARRALNLTTERLLSKTHFKVRKTNGAQRLRQKSASRLGDSRFFAGFDRRTETFFASFAVKIHLTPLSGRQSSALTKRCRAIFSKTPIKRKMD